jgi:hypothetical protein
MIVDFLMLEFLFGVLVNLKCNEEREKSYNNTIQPFCGDNSTSDKISFLCSPLNICMNETAIPNIECNRFNY